MKDSKVVWSVDASDYLKGLQLKFATRFPKKIIRQKGRKKNQRKSDDFFFTFFFQFNSKNFLRGRNSGEAFLKGLEGVDLGWGVLKGGGADLEHTHKTP